MSHGEVHQHEQKSDGSDQTTLEDRCLVILEGFFGFRYGNLFLIGSLEGCAVTCLFYGIDNIMGEAVPSTPMEFVRRLTEQDVTPGTLDTAFSTRVLQAAQLIPVTLYCSIVCLLL